MPDMRPIWHLEDAEMNMYLKKVYVPANTLLIDLSVSHLLKNTVCRTDIEHFQRALAFDSYDFVLATVNVRQYDEQEGGVHWSLLVYEKKTHTYFHLDSLAPMNMIHAEQMAINLSGNTNINVVQLRCRQDGGVECGAYVLHFINMLNNMSVCSTIAHNKPINDETLYLQNFSLLQIYTNIKEQMENAKPTKTIDTILPSEVNNDTETIDVGSTHIGQDTELEFRDKETKRKTCKDNGWTKEDICEKFKMFLMANGYTRNDMHGQKRNVVRDVYKQASSAIFGEQSKKNMLKLKRMFSEDFMGLRSNLPARMDTAEPILENKENRHFNQLVALICKEFGEDVTSSYVIENEKLVFDQLCNELCLLARWSVTKAAVKSKKRCRKLFNLFLTKITLLKKKPCFRFEEI